MNKRKKCPIHRSTNLIILTLVVATIKSKSSSAVVKFGERQLAVSIGGKLTTRHRDSDINRPVETGYFSRGVQSSRLFSARRQRSVEVNTPEASLRRIVSRASCVRPINLTRVSVHA